MNRDGAAGALSEREDLVSVVPAYQPGRSARQGCAVPPKCSAALALRSAFRLPRAPLRGASGVLDSRFAGRWRELSSMRRTATTEVPMTTLHTHPHAAFDRFPQLRRDLIAEFGTDGIDAAIELFIAAERADFHWDGRIAEMNLGAWESLDDENEMFERVTILGYFRARYYVATCLVDGDRDVHWMLGLRHFECFESAEQAFLASGG